MTASTNPFAIRDFRLLLISRVIANLATMGMVVILGYQLYDVARLGGRSIAEASFLLGVMGLVQFLPFIVLTPVAGWAADRFDRRHVAALAMALDTIVALILAIATQNDALSLPLLFAMGALHGAVRVFVRPAISAMTPDIVPAELLPRAIAMSTMAMQLGTIIGPAAAGLLYAVSPAAPYWASVAMMVMSCIMLLSIKRYPTDLAGMRDSHPFRLMAEGFQYVWGDRFLFSCMTLDLFAVLLGGATALMPVFARDILHVGPEGLGLMRAAPSLGAVLVGVWLSWKPIANNVGVKMLWCVVVFGAATIGFGLSKAFWLSLLMLVILGAADMISVFIRVTLVQLRSPDAKRGRISAISNLAISASNELGELQSGLAAAVIGATGAVVFGGVGAIVITAAWALIFPELRNARTFALPDDKPETAP